MANRVNDQLPSPSFLWGAFALLVGLILLQNFVLIAQEASISGGVTSSADVELCVNTPPTVNASSCAAMAFSGTQYNCSLSVSDAQQATFTYGVSRDSGSSVLDPLLVLSGGTLSFTPNATHVGNYTLRFSANDQSGCLYSSGETTLALTINASSGAPYLVQAIPDKQWGANTLLLAWDLDDYFADPDGDVLVYSGTGPTHISISISAGEVLLSPATNWCGSETVVFTATDPTNLSGTSNTVTLNVTCASSTSSSSSSSSSGGGSRGGSSGALYSNQQCYPSYSCYDWSSCQLTRLVEPYQNSTRILTITSVYGKRDYLIDPNATTNPDAYYEGFQYRECVDTRQCSNERRRAHVRVCTYVPSCSDGIQNQGETGLDCGGPCRPCGTCDDGVQNGLESGIDCGGPLCAACGTCSDRVMNNDELGVDCGGESCPRCPSCFDEVQNQDETGVDCGGLFCTACAQEQLPAAGGFPWLTGLLLGLVFLVLLVIFAAALKRRLASWLFAFMLKHARRNRVILISSNLKEEIIERLARLEAVVDTQPILKSQEELARIIRDYFKAALAIDFEFTNEELVVALKENKLNPLLSRIMQQFFIRINELEFSGVKVSSLVLRALVQETRELVYQTAVLTVDDLKAREEDLELRDIPTALPGMDRAYLLLSQVHLCLQFRKLEIGGALYLVLHEWYQHASPAEQHAIHADFARVYDEYMLATSRKL